ncbi:MAG: alpha-galactosidase [Clostridia bacterium]|nr:alpha-galactosidase [Clostridia bacterium]
MKQCYKNPSATRWYRDMAKDPASFPFLFTYDGTEHRGFAGLKLIAKESSRTAKREDNVYRYALDSLTVTLIFTHYPAYGVSESTVWIENTGSETSGVLENLRQVWEFKGENPVLKGILGDHGNQYRPYETDLTAESAHFVSDSGRPTHGNFPYYNLEYGDGGVMLAIGWAGTFTADFTYADGVTTYTANSVNNLKTCLKPGEKIRTALFVIAPYQSRKPGYATNFWRSWFVDCNLPPLDSCGTPVHPMAFCCLSNDTGLPNSDGSISERYFTWKPTLEKMAEVGVHVDVRWFDAGWYIAPDLTSPESNWWGTVGTWELDQHKWPGKTFLESTDYAREHGMRTLMWFEPERVTDVDNLAKNFGYNPEWAIRREGVGSISNNIGIPECYDWTVGRICKVLRENKVEIYREDNNSDPGALWRYLDSLEGENRTGITECKFVDGHYRMWDDIIDCTLSFGGCGFCDSCASGGGRNDLETLRRGIPLLRSDADRTTTALRLSMSWGFNQWIPYCGANTKEKIGELDLTGRSDVYTWRASYLPALNVDSQFTQDPDQDFSILRFGLDEWRKVNPYLLKDFYPLTGWHHRDDKAGFTAFGYHDPDTDKGLLLLFRMEDCESDTLELTIPWMDGASFRFTDEDTGDTWTADSADMVFQLADKRTSRLVWVEKI